MRSNYKDDYRHDTCLLTVKIYIRTIGFCITRHFTTITHSRNAKTLKSIVSFLYSFPGFLVIEFQVLKLTTLSICWVYYWRINCSC